MGHEILPAGSPAHRRVQSSPISAMRRAPFSSRDEPDLSWRALIYRHQFLLLMLGVLLFLCTVYLYFAITLGTAGNSCAGLTGIQKEVCDLSKDKTKRAGARALLTDPIRSWKDLKVAVCVDLRNDGLTCKMLDGGTLQSVESNVAQFDVVLYKRNSLRDDHQVAVTASRLVKKGGLLVSSMDIFEPMQMLNWSLVSRNREQQTSEAPQ